MNHFCVYKTHILGSFYYFQKRFIPTVYKFRLVYTLLHCCLNNTPSFPKFHNEINTLNKIFQLNGYALYFIDRCIKQLNFM